ncbi:hypothetical protein [Planctomicrobium sp. SH527]|uniref:hypothetical protein n=1 Tax=Planctomicrobium sp. SH527 TaxID=3448123 RepID=UPI003F5BC2D4
MIKSFVLGLLIGGTSGLMAMHYHLVRTPERLLLVSRVHQPPLRSIYVDARSWNPARWQHYPELSEAMVKAGHQELLTRDIPRESQTPVLPAGIQHPSLPAQPERFQQFNAIPQINHRASPYRNPPTAQITTEVAAVEVMPLAIVTPIPDGVEAPTTKLIPRTISKKTPAMQVAKPVSEVLPESASAVLDAVEPDSAPTEKQNWMKSLFDSILPTKDSAANVTIPENLQVFLQRVEKESLLATKREEQRILAANKPVEVKVAPTVAPVQQTPVAVAATIEKAAVAAVAAAPKEATPTAASEQMIAAKPAEMAQPAPAAIVAAKPVAAVAAKPIAAVPSNPVTAVATQTTEVAKVVATVKPEPKSAEATRAETKAPVVAIASTPATAVAPPVATTIPEAPPACKPTFTVVPMSSPLRELTPTLARPIADPLATDGIPGQPTVIADAESSFPASPRLIRSQVK